MPSSIVVENVIQDNNGMVYPLLAVVVCMLLGTIALLQRKMKGFPTVLPLSDFVEFTLLKKESLSHDTRRFTFELPAGHVLGLPVGQHMTLKFVDPTDNKPVQRSYTPVTGSGPGLESEVGKVVFVIKVYKANVHPKFPDGGKMSQHLDSLAIGDTILMKGPKGHMEYFGNGQFKVKPLGKPLETRNCTAIGMMAGGTGITPMLQILHSIFRNPNDTTQVKLLYANQTEEDILVREELETLAKEYPNRFQLHYTVDRTPEDGSWKYSTGFITKEMCEQHVLISDRKDQQQFFCCGPPPMMKFACIPSMEALGYTEKNWVIF